MAARGPRALSPLMAPYHGGDERQVIRAAAGAITSMTLASKLQLKEQTICVVNAPSGLQLDVKQASDSPAVLVFAANAAELSDHGLAAIEAAQADALAWIAYPKAGKLGTDLNRDKLWETLQDKGIRPVRQISIDETWSAMRFRPA